MYIYDYLWRCLCMSRKICRKEIASKKEVYKMKGQRLEGNLFFLMYRPWFLLHFLICMHSLKKQIFKQAFLYFIFIYVIQTINQNFIQLYAGFKNPYNLGHLGGSVVERLPSAQIVIPGSWDRVSHQAPYKEPAFPSAYVSVFLCVSNE